MKNRDLLRYILAIFTVLVFFTLMAMIIFKAVPIENKDLFNIMTGFAGAAFAQVINYFFGSSSGSAAKTELLANTQKTE